MAEDEAPRTKRRPARKQVGPDFAQKRHKEVQTGQTYNFWYNKWAGGDSSDHFSPQSKSETRVNIAKDSGYTRADSTNNKYICLFFARGCCPYGHECNYLHRLPVASDPYVFIDASKDCFGRDKHASFRDDLGGVGSFNKQNRTLYVGQMTETKDTAEMVERHFSEFGDIERIRILNHRGVAFVTYDDEVNAQFAKEAMMHQSLDSDECLNVRWAAEDPNPVAKQRHKRELDQQAEKAFEHYIDTKGQHIVQHMLDIEALERGEPESSGEGADPPRKRVRETEEEEKEEENTPTMSILSSNALESLKLAATLKKTEASAAKPSRLASLADYGSDDD